MLAKNLISLLFFLSLPALGVGKVFNLRELPHGKAVTLPHPALTLVPVGDTVTLSSTDLPQTVKMTIAKSSGKASVKVAIFDNHGDVVRYVNIASGATALYTFKELSSIRLVPEISGKRQGTKNTVKLLIESNKPLSIAR